MFASVIMQPRLALALYYCSRGARSAKRRGEREEEKKSQEA
jgi:hypothetical protein